MPKLQSRRDVLALAAAATLGADAGEGEPATRHFVNRFEISVAPRGGSLRTRLTTTGGRVFETEVTLDASESFLKLAQIALDGRGRMTIDVENDGKIVRSLRLEAP